MKKPPAVANVRTYIQHGEFFADEKIVIGSHKTRQEIEALFRWLQGRPVYNEQANMQIIEQFRKEAEAEIWNKEWAQKVLERARRLIHEMDKGDVDAAVYAAFLLEEAYIRMRLQAHEANAEMGREIRESNTKKINGRWERTADERKKRNEAWRQDALRLRALHPEWPERRIGQTILRHTQPPVSLRTILNITSQKKL